MNEKILLVDDDDRILDALKRRLYRKFKITTANSGAKALDILAKDPNYAVVISDQQMPEMNGIMFLRELIKEHPHIIRIMLTGNSDQHTAVCSINDAKVFRYLNKPCEIEDLGKAIIDGINQYRMESAERELLEKTLAGSVKLLTDILAMNDPEAFKQIGIMRIAARQIAKHMKHPRAWELDLTVMLSAIGHVVLPLDLRAKAASGEELSDAERDVFSGAPGIARDLLMNIPRLKSVADAVYYKDKSFDGSGYPKDDVKGKEIPLNARVLHIIEHLLDISNGRPPSLGDFRELVSISYQFDPELMELIQEYFLKNSNADASGGNPNEKELDVAITELCVGDRLLQNLTTENGKLALAADNVLSAALLQQVLQFNKIRKLRQPVRILRNQEEFVIKEMEKS
ncbi:MAG: HD domain-containing phosphohydrolase [Methyloligellaceae bacterium]